MARARAAALAALLLAAHLAVGAGALSLGFLTKVVPRAARKVASLADELAGQADGILDVATDLGMDFGVEWLENQFEEESDPLANMRANLIDPAFTERFRASLDNWASTGRDTPVGLREQHNNLGSSPFDQGSFNFKSAEVDTRGYALRVILSGSADGSTPQCYNPDSGNVEAAPGFEPRWGRAFDNFPSVASPDLPAYDFCSGDVSVLEGFVGAVLAGGSVAAHAATALAYQENYQCPGVAQAVLEVLAALDWTSYESVVSGFFDSLTTAFDRAGMALCALIVKDFEDGTVELYDYYATGANLPSLFFQTDYALLSAPEDTTPVSTPSDYECDYLCWTSEDCYAWSWDSNTNTCELKPAGGWVGQEAVGVVSGVLAATPYSLGEMSTSTEDGYEHTGAALLPEGSQLATADADYCALACALVQSCGAWKFAPDTSVCELLHGSGELQPNPGYTSGVISGGNRM